MREEEMREEEMASGRRHTRPVEERQRRADYRLVFASEAGRRVLADLARVCYGERSTYVRGDALETAFREGERQVYLRILSLLRPLRGERPEDIV